MNFRVKDKIIIINKEDGLSPGDTGVITVIDGFGYLEATINDIEHFMVRPQNVIKLTPASQLLYGKKLPEGVDKEMKALMGVFRGKAQIQTRR